jgi:hypothetical protein
MVTRHGVDHCACPQGGHDDVDDHDGCSVCSSLCARSHDGGLAGASWGLLNSARTGGLRRGNILVVAIGCTADKGQRRASTARPRTTRSGMTGQPIKPVLDRNAETDRSLPDNLTVLVCIPMSRDLLVTRGQQNAPTDKPSGLKSDSGANHHG